MRLAYPSLEGLHLHALADKGHRVATARDTLYEPPSSSYRDGDSGDWAYDEYAAGDTAGEMFARWLPALVVIGLALAVVGRVRAWLRGDS